MDFSKGDRVVTTIDVYGERIGGDGGYYGGNTRRGAPEGSAGTITRTGTASALVRFDTDAEGETIRTPFSIWVNVGHLAIDGSVPRKRRLGEKPEGDEFLDPNDPRLAWFWDDVSTYAAKSAYCSVFDQILRELHLPPRKQQWRAKGTIGDDIEVFADIVAVSQKEANEILAARLAERVKEIVS